MRWLISSFAVTALAALIAFWSAPRVVGWQPTTAETDGMMASRLADEGCRNVSIEPANSVVEADCLSAAGRSLHTTGPRHCLAEGTKLHPNASGDLVCRHADSDVFARDGYVVMALQKSDERNAAAWGIASAGEQRPAQDAALRSCGAGCSIAYVWQGGCIGFAVNGEGKWGWAMTARDIAGTSALEDCGSEGDTSCTMMQAACADDWQIVGPASRPR